MYIAVYTWPSGVHDVSIALVTQALSGGSVGVQWCKASALMLASKYELWFNEDGSPYADAVPGKSVIGIFPSLVESAVPADVIAECTEWLRNHERTDDSASSASSGSDGDSDDGESATSAAGAGAGSAAAPAASQSQRVTRRSGGAAAAASSAAGAGSSSSSAASASASARPKSGKPPRKRRRL